MASGALQRPIVGGTGSESLSVIMARAQQQATAQSAQILSAANNIASQRERAGQAAESAAFRLRMEGFQRMEFDQKKKIEDARLSISQDANKRAEQLQPLTVKGMGLDNELKRLDVQMGPLKRQEMRARIEGIGFQNKAQSMQNDVFEKTSEARVQAFNSTAELDVERSQRDLQFLQDEEKIVTTLGWLLDNLGTTRGQIAQSPLAQMSAEITSAYQGGDPSSAILLGEDARQVEQVKTAIKDLMAENPNVFIESDNAQNSLFSLLDNLNLTKAEQIDLTKPLMGANRGLGGSISDMEVTGATVNAAGQPSLRYTPTRTQREKDVKQETESINAQANRRIDTYKGKIDQIEKDIAIEERKDSPNDSRLDELRGKRTALNNDIDTVNEKRDEFLEEARARLQGQDAQGYPAGDRIVNPVMGYGATDANTFINDTLKK